VRQGRVGNPATSEYTLEIEVCHPNAAWEILGVRSIWCLFNQESKASLPKVPAAVRRRANDIGNVDSGIDDNGGRSEMICPWPLLLQVAAVVVAVVVVVVVLGRANGRLSASGVVES